MCTVDGEVVEEWTHGALCCACLEDTRVLALHAMSLWCRRMVKKPHGVLCHRTSWTPMVSHARQQDPTYK